MNEFHFRLVDAKTNMLQVFCKNIKMLFTSVIRLEISIKNFVNHLETIKFAFQEKQICRLKKIKSKN